MYTYLGSVHNLNDENNERDNFVLDGAIVYN